MPFCHECGLEVAEKDMACPACGAALSHSAAEELSPAATPSMSQLEENAAPDDQPLDDTIQEEKAVTNGVAETALEPIVTNDPGDTAHVGAGETGGRRSGLKQLAEGLLLNGRYRILRKIGGGGMGAVYL